MVVSEEEILEILKQVKDPEIPALTVIDMGIVRGVNIEEDKITIIITPTYSGCPAMFQIRKDIVAKLKSLGFEKVEVVEQISPPWTTDWMTPESKEKLRASGIAPPESSNKTKSDDLFDVITSKRDVHCPFCNSNNVELKSEFGATACKALYFCNNCTQPFEHFKCH